MLKSKKILMAGIVTALFSCTCFANASDSVTKQITVEIEVGPKAFKDKLKISGVTSTNAVKRGASDTDKGASQINDFITWSDATLGSIVVTVSGDKDGGSYFIKSFNGNKMPVSFEIDDMEINETAAGESKKLTLDNEDSKSLKVTYGDGSKAYPEGKYSGNFNFNISASFS